MHHGAYLLIKIELIQESKSLGFSIYGLCEYADLNH